MVPARIPQKDSPGKTLDRIIDPRESGQLHSSCAQQNRLWIIHSPGALAPHLKTETVSFPPRILLWQVVGVQAAGQNFSYWACTPLSTTIVQLNNKVQRLSSGQSVHPTKLAEISSNRSLCLKPLSDADSASDPCQDIIALALGPFSHVQPEPSSMNLSSSDRTLSL